MSKLEIKIDDVVSIVQMMGTVIQKKVLSPEEFRQVQPSWERLSDVIAQLQRRTALEKLYPDTPPVPVPVPVPVQPVPVPSISNTNSAAGATGNTVVETAQLPTSSEATEGTPEPVIEDVTEKVADLSTN